MEPVDPTEAPDYYKVIKEPMGNNTTKYFKLLVTNLNLQICRKLKIKSTITLIAN